MPRPRFIFQTSLFGHIFIYSVVAETPRHARTLIKKAIRNSYNTTVTAEDVIAYMQRAETQ